MAKRVKSLSALIKAFLENDPRMQGVKQAFVVSALDIYARQVISGEAWNPMSGLVTDELWREIARELRDDFSDNYSNEKNAA